jgi:flagellar basal-body rod protein FlgC
MDLATSMAVAASGMRAQSSRMRTIAENIANADSTSQASGGDPYRRKIATISSEFDNEVGAAMVQSGSPTLDQTDFRKTYDPSNPAADAKGYVKLPNVNPLMEMMDMREAQRSYEANLTMLEASKSMLSSTIELLRR